MGWVFWSASVWVIGRRLFGAEPPFDLLLILIGLSYAPLVFGFLILMPYLGPFIHRLLYVWSFLISLRAVSLLFQVGSWPALLCHRDDWAADCGATQLDMAAHYKDAEGRSGTRVAQAICAGSIAPSAIQRR
jgi:hypothetical protein